MKRILSGINPSGSGMLHLGNFLGAVKQFITLAKSHQCFLFIADLHALTTVQNKKQLEENIQELVCQELALLGDLSNIIFFRQSAVKEHSELAVILGNVTPLGLLKRAHAFKDKLQKTIPFEEINLGLFSYPVLMAADILLYQPDFVPVGQDQKQHLEITRDLASRFNKIFQKEVFKLPEPYIPPETAVILGTDGKRKMSKTLGNVINMLAPEEVLKKQVNSCYTDPTRLHPTDPGHLAGNMVFTYLDFFGEKKEVARLKKLYQDGKIADVKVKDYLFQVLLKTFSSERKRYRQLKEDPAQVRKILAQGAKMARKEAEKTMVKVREAVGLG